MSHETHIEGSGITTLELDKKKPFMLLGSEAEGKIQGSIETHPRLDELTERLASGEFHVTTDIVLPCGCIDGRCGCWPRPDSAGGTYTMAVADDLLEQSYAGDGTTAEMARNVFRELSRRGFPVGGHTDASAEGDASGCGANDRLAQIYDLLKRKNYAIREFASGLGIEVSDDDHQAIVDGASRRTTFSTGREVLDVMKEESPQGNVDTLVGPHLEVVAVVNTRPGTTLNRDALAAEFGEEYEAFNVDVWSFEAGARALYPDASDEIIQRTVAAMVYYNLATALTLCGPNMRVVVLD